MSGIADPTQEHFKDGTWAWNTVTDEWDKVTISDGKLEVSSVAAAHAASHQDGGSDEISVAALSGDLADAQDAKAHLLGSATHSADTLAHLNLKVSDATLDDSAATRTPAAHAASHQNTGSDEISVAALSGLLADSQTPLAHKASHAGGGADKVKYTRQILWYLPDATLATGTDKSATIVYRGPTLTLVRWDFRAKTAPTTADMIADVNIAGTSLWNTTQANRPTIAATATSGTGTAFDTTTLSDADMLTLDIDQVGSTIPGGQVTLILEGEANPETD